MQRLTKRNIKVINHDTGQQIDFPTFGKEAGEDAYNQVSNQLTSLQSQLESSIASMSEAIVTDKTLTIEDAPADAKATGDAINNLRGAVGSPLVAATAAAMTDTNKVYVYTGSETGYTNGNWYYHDGTSWVSGGVYNSVAVDLDTTLKVSGKASDSKSVGDAISELKENLKSKLTNSTLSASKQNCLEMIPLCDPVAKTHNGITFTPSSDGYTFVSTGTPTRDYIYIIFNGEIEDSPFVPGGKYRIKYTAPDKTYFQMLSGDTPIINTLSFTGEKVVTIPNDVTVFTVRIYCRSSAVAGTYILSVVNERAEDYIEKNIDYKSTLELADFSWDKIFIESGALSSLTGEGSVNFQRLRTEFFFACKGGIIQSLNGQKFMVCSYSDPSESAFIDGVGFGTDTYTMPRDGFYRIATRADTETYFRNINDFVNNIVVNAKIAISRNKRKIKYGKDEVCPYYYIDSTGAVHESATLGCTSYLPIKGAKRISLTFMQMTTSNDYGLAFYDSSKTFISFIRQSIDVGSSGSFPYKTYDVPSGAEYIRVTSFINTTETANKNNFYIEFVTEEMSEKRPYQSGYFFFSRAVNQAVNQYWIDDDATELDYSPADTTGVIALPSNYSADGDPVPVIMYFHGFSHYVYMDNWGATDTFRTQKQHWLDMGFAVMDCNGGRNNNKVGGYTSGGSIQYVNGYKECWEYIKKNYNVDHKVYISGGSAGGIAAINYCLWYADDVRAACLLSPWTDLYTLSWQQGIVAQIKEYLGMGNDYDSDKAIGFDPAVRMITIGNNKYLPGWHIPTKILVGSEETETAIYGCLVPFVTALRNAGETVNLRVLDGATHQDVVSGGILYIDTEVGNWFKSV